MNYCCCRGNKGVWNGYSVNQEGITELSIAMVAKDFMTAARAGDVQVKEEQQRDEAVSTAKVDSTI